MQLFRHSMMRRFILFILLSWGLLAQLATVYACDTHNGGKQISCCCDSGVKMDCAHKGSPCNNADDSATYDSINTFSSSCCSISYGVTDVSPASATSVAAAIQLLLLDAPQPPPVPRHQHPDSIIADTPLIVFSTFTPSTSGTSTYLRTHRLRV